MVAVSVLEVAPNTVTRLRTDGARRVHGRPARHGREEEAHQAAGRPAQGPAARGDAARVPAGRPGRATRSARRSRSPTCFAAGDLVDVTGVSKGKGFAGHIKRHHFHRGPKTHGSDHHREPGSIGPGTTPGRVYKGVRMAGHMGDEQVTTKKVKVVQRRRRPEPAPAQGQPARRPGQPDPREEGLTCPRPPSTTDRRVRRQRRAQRRALRRAGERRRAPPGRDGPARRPAHGHARHEDPRRGPRWRQEAVPPEGHRPRPAGHQVARPTTAAAERSSGRTRAPTSSGCRRRCAGSPSAAR